MKASDYIVSFFAAKGVRHAFGYPGGMVTHLIDSFAAFRNRIAAHVNYHEQAAAFAACGYAQHAFNPCVAYATSGPGVTNLLTGIAHAYFDSVPVIFLTGQINTYEAKGDLPVRQRGFQEMEVVPVVASLTKYAAAVKDASELRHCLEKAWHCATSGRPGPVLLDIPMNIQRAEINPETLTGFSPPADAGNRAPAAEVAEVVNEALRRSKHPCILFGAGVRTSGSQSREQVSEWMRKIHAPAVSSMLAIDVFSESDRYYGFVGAYGMRHANMILAKSDCVVSLGSRLDLRQTGNMRDAFAPRAKLIRVDIDPGELAYKVKEDEQSFAVDLSALLPELLAPHREYPEHAGWLAVCDELKARLAGYDDQPANAFVRELGDAIPPDAVITTDVGQNQVWVAQSLAARGRRVLFSGGHGAMGYALPAAIGAHYASGKPVFAFTGDGGLQMNIQELQFIARERLPIKIILLNNQSLGMIRHFQEMYFDGNYQQTKQEGGYTAPDFVAVCGAYGIQSRRISSLSDCAEQSGIMNSDKPALLEITLPDTTYVFPKLGMGKPVHHQEPQISDAELDYLTSL